jgi:hypothetical protein
MTGSGTQIGKQKLGVPNQRCRLDAEERKIINKETISFVLVQRVFLLLLA